MKALHGRSVLLTLPAALLLTGALLTPAPALGKDFCRLLDRFPATGQETCWRTSDNAEVTCGTEGTGGQDGDVQAGGPLRYRDLGNGTILDKNTLLVWEKLCDEDPDNPDPGATCPAVHDVDTKYTWAEAFAVKIAALNSPPCFARHCDWRLPNVKELMSIVNYENDSPAVSEAFDNGDCGVAACSVLTCSCTGVASSYWSSSTSAVTPSSAWIVDFGSGFVGNVVKNSIFFSVRAVRGGCVD